MTTSSLFRQIVIILISIVAFTACAHIDFDRDLEKDGLTYFEPKPYLAVSTILDVKSGFCSTTASVLVLPGVARKLKLKSGIGAADLSVTIGNSMVTQVGQKSDTKIPETIDSLANLAGAIAKPLKRDFEQKNVPTFSCEPSTLLYEIDRKTGEINENPVKLKLENE